MSELIFFPTIWLLYVCYSSKDFRFLLIAHSSCLWAMRLTFAACLTFFERPCLFWLDPFLLANQSTNLDQWQIKPASYLYNEVNSSYQLVKISLFEKNTSPEFSFLKVCARLSQNRSDDTERKRTIKRRLDTILSKELSEAFYNNCCEFVSKISSLKTGVSLSNLFIFHTRSNLLMTKRI